MPTRDRQFNNNHIRFNVDSAKDGEFCIETRVVDDSPSIGIVVNTLFLTLSELRHLQGEIEVCLANESYHRSKM